MYARHEETQAVVPASPNDVFSYLDDFHKLSGHMERRSGMMAGSSMTIETDAGEGRAVGSRIRMAGTVLGMHLTLEEVVTRREAPSRKEWETAQADLLVIGPYRLGFELSPDSAGTRIRVYIDYDLPPSGAGVVLGRLLGGIYARWCTRKMARDALAAFARA